jgi:hypothetical protein
MDFQLTIRDLQLATAIYAGAALLTVVPLALAFSRSMFKQAGLTMTVASALFWGVLTAVFVFGFWDLYYQFFYPLWLRWVAALDALGYALVGLVMWWLASRLPGNGVLWFALLGGLEGVLEHVIAIYVFGVLTQVPYLQNLSPVSVIVFSFFEYLAYWGLVVWMAFGLKVLFRRAS